MTPTQRQESTRIVHDACLRGGIGYDHLHVEERPNNWTMIRIVNPDRHVSLPPTTRRKLREYNVEVSYEYR